MSEDFEIHLDDLFLESTAPETGYVYYEPVTGQITSVGLYADTSSDHPFVIADSATILGFLSGEQNIADFYVGLAGFDADAPALLPRGTRYIRLIDDAPLEEIGLEDDASPVKLVVEHFYREGKVAVSLQSDVDVLFTHGAEVDLQFTPVGRDLVVSSKTVRLDDLVTGKRQVFDVTGAELRLVATRSLPIVFRRLEGHVKQFKRLRRKGLISASRASDSVLLMTFAGDKVFLSLNLKAGNAFIPENDMVCVSYSRYDQPLTSLGGFSFSATELFVNGHLVVDGVTPPGTCSVFLTPFVSSAAIVNHQHFNTVSPFVPARPGHSSALHLRLMDRKMTVELSDNVTVPDIDEFSVGFLKSNSDIFVHIISVPMEKLTTFRKMVLALPESVCGDERIFVTAISFDHTYEIVK